MYISVEATRWVWTESLSERSARLVMLAIAAHCNEDGYAWPSQETIMECCKLSKPIVIEAIEKLVVLNELTYEKGGKGAGDTNRYYLRAFMESRVNKCKENPEKGKETSQEGYTRVDTNKNLEQEVLEENRPINFVEKAIQESHRTGQSADEILKRLRVEAAL
jgi:hypothetical protein